MALNLDLSSSLAKIARARIHVEALKGEIESIIHKRNPYSMLAGEINKQSGVCPIILTPGDFTERSLGVIIGDLIHNLRSALDYIVTALADASRVELKDRHQFPIFLEKVSYIRSIGTMSSANPYPSSLAGIIYGLSDIWDLQPFHQKIEPEFHPLFLINRFSNADKHRLLAQYMPIPITGECEVIHDGCLVEQSGITPVTGGWESNRTYEVGWLRFIPPYPTKIDLQGNISVNICFGTTPFANDKTGRMIEISEFNAMCDYVDMIAHHFKGL